MALRVDPNTVTDDEIRGWLDILEHRARHKFKLEVGHIEPAQRDQLCQGLVDRVIVKGYWRLNRAMAWADQWIKDYLALRGK